jgi:hypothetical protein
LPDAKIGGKRCLLMSPNLMNNSGEAFGEACALFSNSHAENIQSLSRRYAKMWANPHQGKGSAGQGTTVVKALFPIWHGETSANQIGSGQKAPDALIDLGLVLRLFPKEQRVSDLKSALENACASFRYS